jgi:hypothetical protein
MNRSAQIFGSPPSQQLLPFARLDRRCLFALCINRKVAGLWMGGADGSLTRRSTRPLPTRLRGLQQIYLRMPLMYSHVGARWACRCR